MRFFLRNARSIAAGFLLLFLSSFGQSFFVSLSGGEIRREFALSNGEFGLLYMGVTLAGAATLAAFGSLVDRWPARRVASAVVLVIALGALALALGTHPVALALALFLLRLGGQGFAVHAAYTFLGRWFAAERGRAVSLASLGLNTGQAILPLAFVALAALLGWRGVWIGVALLLLLIPPILYWLLREEPQPVQAAISHDAGEKQGWTRRAALRDPLFPLLLLAMLPPAFISNTIFFHQSHLAELRGWPDALWPSVIPLYALASVGSLLVAGPLVDRLSARALLPFYLLPFAAALLALGVMEGAVGVTAFMLLYGITDGVSLTLFGTLWPEVYGTRHLGAIRSTLVAITVLAAAFGPGLAGLLIDAGVPYPAIVTAMGFYCLGVSALMIPVRRRLDRRLLASSALREPSGTA